jgi:sulfate/thiosulfate transport system permease protein
VSSSAAGAARALSRPASSEAPVVRLCLIAVSLCFLGLFVVTPLILVFAQALSGGVSAYVAAISEPVALSAVRLTLLVAAIAVPLNLVFGVAAAWLIAKFNFVGKSLLTTIVDIPLAVSPVISGMVFLLVFGAQGLFGPWLREHDFKIVFAVPGIVLATLFVTFPLVAREVVPVMEAAGNDEEEAGLMLGASSWQTFWRITLPKVKWGVIYGVLLTNARAMGEFGAVSVVSGHIRGETNTVPLHAEILFNEYQYVGAFAVASLLALLGLATLLAQQILAWWARTQADEGERVVRIGRV